MGTYWVNKILIIFTLLQISYIANTQVVSNNLFEKEKMEYYKEKTDSLKNSLLIKRENSNIVILSFFEEFDDTVALFVNNKQVGQWLIEGKGNPVISSGHSGLDFGLLFKKRKSIIVIKLLRQLKYIEFIVDKKYPLYSIQRHDYTWYINARKYMMVLK